MAELDVLVAHDSAEMRTEIRTALAGKVHTMADAVNGEEALHRILRDHPRLLVVDVGLEGRAPFELCDDIQQAGLRTRVLLVASVYNNTRYKRRPTSLYGADDYVEQHHIPDMLLAKAERLLGRDVPPPVRGGLDVDPAAAQRVREAGDAMLTIRFSTLEEGHARAARLCELIVADMTLYNGDLVRSLRPGDELPAQIRGDLEEARELFERRVPESIRGSRDWVSDQFAELLERQWACDRLQKEAAP